MTVEDRLALKEELERLHAVKLSLKKKRVVTEAEAPTSGKKAALELIDRKLARVSESQRVTRSTIAKESDGYKVALASAKKEIGFKDDGSVINVSQYAFQFRCSGETAWYKFHLSSDSKEVIAWGAVI